VCVRACVLAAILTATLGSLVPPRAGLGLDPLSLLQDKAAQVTTLKPYAPPPGKETATLALG